MRKEMRICAVPVMTEPSGQGDSVHGEVKRVRSLGRNLGEQNRLSVVLGTNAIGSGPAGPGSASGSGALLGSADVTMTLYRPASSPLAAGMLYRPSLMMAPPLDPSDESSGRKITPPWSSGLPRHLTSPATAKRFGPRSAQPTKPATTAQAQTHAVRCRIGYMGDARSGKH